MYDETRTNYQLCQLSPADLDAVGALRLRVWSGLALSFGLQVPSPVASLDRWDKLLDTAQFGIRIHGVLIAAARVTVADRLIDLPDGRLFAQYTQLEPSRRRANITRLVVAPEHRLRGLATQLDEARLNWARDQGAVAVLAYHSQKRAELLSKTGSWTELAEVSETPWFYPPRWGRPVLSATLEES